MPVFIWRAGDTIDFVSYKKTPIAVLGKLFDGKVLKQLLRGEIDISVVAKSQLERLREQLSDVLRPVAKALGRAISNSPADEAMAMLSHRRVKTLFIYSPGDVGLDVFELNFGRAGWKLPPEAGATVKIVPSLDHNLSTRNMRDTAFDIVIHWLSEVNRGGPGGVDDPSGARHSESRLV